jgi:hypothetical protein
MSPRSRAPTSPDAYWRDQGLQELALEARERQQVAPPAEPGIDHDAIEHRVAQQTVDRFAAMLRKEYWTLPELRHQHREAIAAATLDFGLRRRRTPAPSAVAIPFTP